jgi:hypothetical protein
MSAQEIIAELWKLRPEELRLVKAQVEAISAAAPTPGHSGLAASQTPATPAKASLSEFLLSVAGTASGLPSDMAENHDHYLYGMPKRTQR